MTEFKKIFDEAWGNAHSIYNQKNDVKHLCEEDARILRAFIKKADDTMPAEEKVLDEWAWPDEDPVREWGEFLYSYKVAADILKEKGYSYADIKKMGDADHHDVPSYNNDLEFLYDGFFWETTLQKYME